MEVLPSGRGCGEQWVRERYPTAVGAYRERSARAKTALFVTIDADTEDVERRQRQLRESLTQLGLSVRTQEESIVHLIPKRSIETWVLFLHGRTVDEDTDYSRDPQVDSLIAIAAVAFFDLSRTNPTLRPNIVPSLSAAIPEVRRLD